LRFLDIWRQQIHNGYHWSLGVSVLCRARATSAAGAAKGWLGFINDKDVFGFSLSIICMMLWLVVFGKHICRMASLALLHERILIFEPI
jgi:hypothetical protein